ncbi:hypothetical protein DXT88_13940 [Herbaspirillum lusitanum]|uniref:head-tail joining protein n=1 Tax=Herbaspirillum lusitanum TaxID=213312 RepID=UPI0022380F1E|nr:hypothetical protein [Herbaspirillum lusitanum]MCW5299278.1 hypothetical protein [Herbaspirillum lusitanum]
MKLAEDLTTFFRDFGDNAHWQPSTGGQALDVLVIFDNPDELVLGDQLLVQNTSTIMYITGSLPGLAEEEVLTINGSQWRVQQPPKAVEDGKLTIAQIIEA